MPITRFITRFPLLHIVIFSILSCYYIIITHYYKPTILFHCKFLIRNYVLNHSYVIVTSLLQMANHVRIMIPLLCTMQRLYLHDYIQVIVLLPISITSLLKRGLSLPIITHLSPLSLKNGRCWTVLVPMGMLLASSLLASKLSSERAISKNPHI